MKSRLGWIGCLAGFLAVSAMPCGGAVVDFETVPVGDRYGGDFDDSPGDTVLVQDGIRMVLREFRIPDFIGFGKAEVGGQYADQFDSTPLELRSISVQFDFGELSFAVSEVALDFIDFGGFVNFAVNSEAIIAVPDLSDVPTLVSDGIFISVADGRLTLTADEFHTIQRFTIGGQELVIDNVAAVPEPSTVALLVAGCFALVWRRRPM